MRRLPILLLAVATRLPAADSALLHSDFLRLTELGRQALAENRFAEADRYFQAACPAEALPGYRPANAASCYHHLGQTAIATGRADEAGELLVRAAEAWLAAGPAWTPHRATTLFCLAELYRTRHRTTEAEALIRDYLAGVSPQSADDALRPEMLSRLALLYADTGRPREAMQLAEDALLGFGSLREPRPAEEAYARNTLGMVALSLAQDDQAITHLRAAVQLGSTALGATHPEALGYRTNLALALLSKGEVEAAGQLLTAVRAQAEKQAGVSDQQFAQLATQLSAVALRRNKPGIAAEEGRRAVSLFRQSGADPRMLASAQVNLGEVYIRSHRLPEAEALLTEAIATERQYAPDSRLLADGLRRLAFLRRTQGRWKESQAGLREALDIYDRLLGPSSPALAAPLREYAEGLKHEGASRAEQRDADSRLRGITGFAPVR